MKTILVAEIIGTIFIVIAGSLFHFVYEWLHFWKPSALIFAVNESTWEHLKLAFWPALIFAGIEWAFIKKHTRNFMIAKTASLYVMPLLIIALFYFYVAISGHHDLFIDIAIFIVAVIIGQIISYAVMQSNLFSRRAAAIALGFFIVLLIAFMALTFFPPGIFLFKDPLTGGYGIVR